MKRLGYTRYVSQGRLCSVIADAMGRQAPAGLLGIHVNMPATVPAVAKALRAGDLAPAGLSLEHLAHLDAAPRRLLRCFRYGVA